MDKQKAIELIRGEFGKALLENMMNYVTTIAWGSFIARKFEIQANGSAFILDLGEGPFLVTAAHVYEGYLEAKSRTAGFKSVLGELEFNFEDRLICSLGSSILDIATFKINESEIASLKKHVSYGAGEWPIKRVSEGQGVIFAGFPGLERRALALQEYVFGLYVALSPVSSSSDRSFGCVFSRQNWIDTLELGFPPVGYDMGGMSGGPVFLYKDSEGIVSWDLVGVIYNATNQFGEILLMHHSCFIGSNGKLDPP